MTTPRNRARFGRLVISAVTFSRFCGDAKHRVSTSNACNFFRVNVIALGGSPTGVLASMFLRGDLAVLPQHFRAPTIVVEIVYLHPNTNAMRYLDPKNDLTFKKLFGQNPDLLMSLLNALMPLAPGQEIVSVEYLPAEMVPEIPEMKNSIVDVRCVDNHKRQFIVEMQMLWTPRFKYRMLFNASKAYVQQLGAGKKYESLQPVYALSLINDIFLDNDPDYYHHYSIVNVEKPALRLEGLEFVFVELPKFKPQTMVEKKMAALWLRFLTEIEDGNETIAPELLDNELTHKALDILQASAFSKAELEAYDRCWDAIRKEMTYATEKAHIAEVKGRTEGKIEVTEKMIVKCHNKGMTTEEIADFTDSTTEEVLSVLRRNELV